MKLYFDGGCQPNPGMMEAAIVSDCGTITIHHEKLGHGTNNEAEWISMIMAVTEVADRDLKGVTILGDSMLVVNQSQGTWKCNHAHLRKYLDAFKEIASGLDIKVQHVRRNHNLAGIYIEEVQKAR